MLPCTWKTQPDKEGREKLSGRQEEPEVASGLNNTGACKEDQRNQSPTDIVNSAIDPSGNLLPCFPDNKTGLILIFTPKYGTRAYYFWGMYYFDISKNEVTK